MTLLFVAIRVVVILLVIRYVLRVVAIARHHASSPRQGRSAVRAGGTLVRDPQCGTYLPESRAISVARGAHVLHFCSTACRDAYALAERGGRLPDTLRTP